MDVVFIFCSVLHNEPSLAILYFIIISRCSIHTSSLTQNNSTTQYPIYIFLREATKVGAIPFFIEQFKVWQTLSSYIYIPSLCKLENFKQERLLLGVRERLRDFLLIFSYLQGYHGLSKDDDRLWAMEIDREHSRGGGVLPHHSHAHLGWAGLDPPPVGALPLPSPHTTLAGEWSDDTGGEYDMMCVFRWPKRVPAPGKLRDPASQYWSIQHSGHNGEWPWPGERRRGVTCDK